MINLIIETNESFIEMVKQPPNSLWFIIMIAIGVSLFSSTLNKVLVDHKQINRQQKVIQRHNEKKKELFDVAEKNPKKYAKQYRKWLRRDASIQKMQRSMSMSRLKPTCITFLPMLIFFYVVRGIYTGESGVQFPVGKLVMNPMQEFPSFITGILRSEWYSAIRNLYIDEGWIGFTGYYFLCSISLSTMIQKLLGISRPTGQAGGAGGMGGMFDTKAQMDLPDPKDLM